MICSDNIGLVMFYKKLASLDISAFCTNKGHDDTDMMVNYTSISNTE